MMMTSQNHSTFWKALSKVNARNPLLTNGCGTAFGGKTSGTVLSKISEAFSKLRRGGGMLTAVLFGRMFEMVEHLSLVLMSIELRGEEAICDRVEK